MNSKVQQAVAIALSTAAAAIAVVPRASAATELPVPCAGSSCGAHGPTSWVTSGAAKLVQSANQLTVNQTSNNATLNWRSFNISAGGKVTFVQPSTSAIALNRIFQADASKIFGSLNSNGTVYLLNQNGFLFGSGSAVNVGGLLASSLQLSQAAMERGVAGASAKSNSTTGALPSDSLEPYTDAQGNYIPNFGSIKVESGASIKSNGGQVLLFAPTVENAGTIETPSGQTILGAGQRVFLAVSQDPNVRGLIVQVGGNGTVTNDSVGQIISNSGNVTLAGSAVNQSGRVSATTTVRSNGSIYLQAQSTDATTLSGSTTVATVGNEGGTLTLGPSSVTSVSLEGSPDDKTVDANAQPKSAIQISGAQIDVLDHASITAPSGNVTLTALSNPQTLLLQAQQKPSQTDSSRVYLAPTSVIDVSGATVSLPVSDNSLAVQLRGTEFEDFPVQRQGPLRGSTVYVDIRQHGTRSDGTTWVGTPLADLSGDVSTIQRDVFERNLTGGTIQLNANGSVIVPSGATLNVSGGQINWQSGYVKSSVLVGANGALTPIGTANPQQTYLGTLDTISQNDPHWGSVSTITTPGYDPRGIYQAGYAEGKDAGSLSIIAPAFVLDGTVQATSVRGPLQRNPDTNYVLNPYYPGQMYRFPDQVPQGGTLVIGNSGALNLDTQPQQREVLENLTFASGAVLPTLTGPNGQPFDPEQDPLPDGFVSSLRPQLLGPSGISQLGVYAEGSITVPHGTALTPGPGGSITLAAGDIEFAGNIQSNGGSVALVATPTILRGGTVLAEGQADSPPTQLNLAAGSSIDVRGAWVNDYSLLGPAPTAPLFINGGTVQLLAPRGGNFNLLAGASVDVSGGAQRTVTNSLVAGAGGAITAGVLPSGVKDNPTSVRLGATLTGYALVNGGTLSLTLPNLCVSSVACTDPKALQINPDLLTDYGFGQVTLAAAAAPGTSGGLAVASDVNLAVRQRNFAFLPGAFSNPSATSLTGMTQVVTLPDNLRQPESLTLTSDASSNQVSGIIRYADLRIGSGADLEFDPAANVVLATNSRVFLDGLIHAPSGSVSVSIRNDIQDKNNETVLDDQAIWFGPNAKIDVSGVVQTTPSDTGLSIGKVLAGGSVSLNAGRGYLVGLPGSQVVASGTSADLDLRSPGSGTYTRQTVASTGGSIKLAASEGIQWGGVLSAPSGAAGEVPGGSLSVTLDGNDARAVGGGPRTLTITSSNAPIIIGEGAAVPEFLNGTARLSASLINGGGFDNVLLTSRELFLLNGSSVLVHQGQSAVAFDPGVSLKVPASLIIDAPEISARGAGDISLTSAYVRLGSSDTNYQQLNPNAITGLGQLSVHASLVDLVGTSDLNGFGSATLSSSGDIRAIGVQLAANQTSGFDGALSTPGALTLSAQQIYPTTLTNFNIQLTGPTPIQSTLTITKAAGTPSPVLSAAGSLTLSAVNIEDSGVLKAPIGTIALQGQSVTLEDGALISVSAAGTTIPFGQIQGGLDWVYALQPPASAQSAGVYTVYGTGAGDTPLPQKQVEINAPRFQFSSGATIDTSGGGDLLAYEWTPGLGGTRDVLSASQNANTFAIVPGVSLPFAPIDPTENVGFTQPVGSSVYLSGGGGLRAGTYALLPARYAILPGAYLVRPVTGYTDLAAGQTISQLDGGTIVSGQRVNAGTGAHDSRTSGFDVISGKDALFGKYSEAQYTLTSANTFFANQAQNNGVTTPRLPVDAGSLALNISQSAQLQGKLLGSAPTGGRGGTVDITASDLFVTANATDAPVGAVVLDVSQLNALGAESLLLGATRSAAKGGYVELNVPEGAGNGGSSGGSTNVVEIDSGATLSGPEIILAASGSIKLDGSAAINITGTSPGAEPDLLAPTGTAVIRASTGSQVALNPAAAAQAGNAPVTGSIGNISVASGGSISAPGSISIDAGGAVGFDGTLSAAGAAVRLGGQQLVLGAAPAGTQGFVIGPALFRGLNNADLTLQATNLNNPIEVFGPVDLSLSALTVDAAGIAGISTPTSPASLNVTAQTITLQSGSQQPYAPAATGSDVLSLTAQHLNLGTGTFTVSGFSGTNLTASQDLTSTANGTFGVPGSLVIKSPIMQSSAGASYKFNAVGDLTTDFAGSGAGKASAASGPGGALSLSAGGNMALGGYVFLPGGRLVATANGGVEAPTGATLDVSGFSRTFDGEVRSADGGTIQLTSATQNVQLDSGSIVDVSAGTGQGGGGTLSLVAPSGAVAVAGQVRGAGASGATGGTLNVEAQQLDFAGLVGRAGTAGFTGKVSLHERGPGSFLIDSGTTLRANDVELTADSGSVTVRGTIDARNPTGGTIILAGSGLYLAGSLEADATSSADRGGTVELFSTSGLNVERGSTISVGGPNASATGTVWLRAPQSVVETALPGHGPQIIYLDGAVAGAGKLVLEAYNSYPTDAQNPTSISSTDVDFTKNAAWYGPAHDFILNEAPLVLQVLAGSKGLANNANFTILPGIEIDAGDLHVSAPWDLFQWRFGPNQTTPGVLTIRAQGSLYVDNSISDGFSYGLDQYNGFSLDSTPESSWSYRLVSGSNTVSANPMAVFNTTELAKTGSDQGSFFVAAGTPGTVSGATQPTVIRTGTGTIDIAAAGNLQLGYIQPGSQNSRLSSQAAVIYTAGTAGPAGIPVSGGGSSNFADPVYGAGGGSITVNAGGDIIGAPSNQLFTDWLFRAGNNQASSFLPVAWVPNYATFEQGIGALGGGDLTIHAGGNITDLGANVPSTGVPFGDGTASGTTTTQINDGLLTVKAGGDINGGKFLDMAGSARISSGGALQTGSTQMANGPNPTVALNPILATGSGQFVVTSRSDIEIDAMFDPTLLPDSTLQQSRGANIPYFGGYTDASRVELLSVGGSINYLNRTGAQGPVQVSATNLSFTGDNGGLGMRVLPPTLAAVALGGDVAFNGDVSLWPSAHGNLDLLAARSVKLNNSAILLSDVDPNTLPTISSSGPGVAAHVTSLNVLDNSPSGLAFAPSSPGLHAAAPIHGGAFTPDGQPDLTPARIVALTGDVVEQAPPASTLAIDVPKPIDIVAGRDIANLSVNIQQFSDGNTSSIIAGRDIVYPFARDSLGALQPNRDAINIAGPGQLDVQAGRNVNLGTSQGISSVGNQFNPALPATGANISVAAGINSQPHYDQFINDYLVQSSLYDQQLFQFISALTGRQDLTKQQALAILQGLPTQEQAPLVQTVLFDELRAGGRSAAAAGPGYHNYTRAFKALTTLFPGANPDLAKGETVPYQGNIQLFFSRVYTTSGGDINLIAPGGQVDVGLAVAPVSFGVQKPPQQLGVVAQSTGSLNMLAYGDLQVNQSRVFAADGGNILMWSTEGNIDAGRGSKTAISAPPPIVTVDPSSGKISEQFPNALTGSGIQALGGLGVKPGDVDLFAPHGVVNANDAGIVAGNLTIAATAVLGANNITVSGTAVGLPPEVTGLGAGLAAASSAGAAAGSTAEASLGESNKGANQAPQTESALGWLDVFVLGLGEEQCKAEDLECIKRQKH